MQRGIDVEHPLRQCLFTATSTLACTGLWGGGVTLASLNRLQQWCAVLASAPGCKGARSYVRQLWLGLQMVVVSRGPEVANTSM